MSPLKPTRNPNRRVGVPKSTTPEAQPEPTAAAVELEELPTDLSALAVILESAMGGGRAQVSNPNTQLPTPKSQIQTPNTQIPAPNTQIPSLDEDLHDDEPYIELELPVAVHALQVTPADAPPRSGETTEREVAAFDEVARSLAAAEAC